ncbi:Kinetochore-associated protein 1 [Galemys pyrenaicus]|uniref:Kinetochore-associated protein 1 n=1 Tax=Galemys pyrenaicus TaxID=202257 RepID=A0A8J6A634_GALPY|nr:Kinetochore-associated protein 1 [Galemys pyrenaicus]
MLAGKRGVFLLIGGRGGAVIRRGLTLSRLTCHLTSADRPECSPALNHTCHSPAGALLPAQIASCSPIHLPSSNPLLQRPGRRPTPLPTFAGVARPPAFCIIDFFGSQLRCNPFSPKQILLRRPPTPAILLSPACDDLFLLHAASDKQWMFLHYKPPACKNSTRCRCRQVLHFRARAAVGVGREGALLRGRNGGNGKSRGAIKNADFSAAKKLQGEIKSSFISAEKYHPHGCLNLVPGDLTSEVPVLIGGAGSCAFSIWEPDSSRTGMTVKNVIDAEIIKGAKKFQLIDNLLFVLDTDNVLSLWEIYTLTPIWNWPSLSVEEFLLTTEADSPASVTWQGITNLKLVALTTTANKKVKNLMVYSLPTMEILYSLEVSGVSCLVQTGISTDTIYLLEGICKSDPKSSEDSVSVLVLRCLTEALPENRLSRLLHKHRFAEAESFAIQFGLDVELVYKVKANDILEKLALTSADSSQQTRWQDLVGEAKENLSKIQVCVGAPGALGLVGRVHAAPHGVCLCKQDDEFVVNYCLEAQWITYETTQEMLSYARARLLKKEDKAVPFSSDGLLKVVKAQAKLTTFHGAFGPEKFSGSSWIEFLNNEDDLRDIFLQLREENLVCAQYLWLRNQANFESRFNVKMLEHLLNSISTPVSLQKLCPWLKNDVIPFVRRTVPEGQRILAKWLEQAARNLELTDKANWPENGLQLAELFFTAETPNELGLASSWHWISVKDYQDTEEVCQLRALVKNLQELIALHRKYNCRLPLSDFEKENRTTIVFRMFDKVLAPELIPSVLEKSVRVYMREHGLPEEELLLLYIEDLLKRCSSKSTSLFETAWEAKAMAIIGCLSDTDLIFDAVLKIMYAAVVPWSAAVEQLVKRHLEMDHPKVKLLQESYKLMEIKKLLRGYGIREVNLLNKDIMRVVRYILKQDVPSSLQDALKVARAYMLPDDEIYSLRMIDLIDREQGEDCISLLRSLPPAQAEKAAERVIIWARLALQEEPDNSEEDKAWRVSAAKTVAGVLRVLCDIQKGRAASVPASWVRDNPQKKDECEENWKVFKMVAGLQEHFEVFLPLGRYSSSSLMAELREQHITAHRAAQAQYKPSSAAEPGATAGSSPRTPAKLHRQALALQLSAPELETELAWRAVKDGDVQTALEKCRALFQYYQSADTGRWLFLTCQKLCRVLANGVPMATPAGLSLPSEVHALACRAAAVCSPEMLLDALELCKYTLMAVQLARQCQIDDCSLLTKTAFGAQKDPYEEWSYGDFFSEDGIVLEPHLVLPVIYELIASLTPPAGNSPVVLLSHDPLYPRGRARGVGGDSLISPVISSISALLQNLQESSQWELALGFIVGSFGTCLQHSVSNVMNASLSEKLFGEAALAQSRHVVMDLRERAVAFVRSSASRLLHKVFNCRPVDVDLALGYCTLLPQKEVFENLWKLIDKAWQNYDKILAISLVGSQLASLCQDIEMELKFRELSTDALWGLRLGKLGISFQPVFRQHFLTKKNLIKALVENVDVDTSLILEYCHTFQLDCDAALQLFIETLLRSTNASQGQGDARGEATEQWLPRLLARAAEMVPLLSSTKDLVVSLSGLLGELNPYDYEMIEVVLKVIERADEKITNININQALSLLKHLKSYRRISPPVDLEYQYMLAHVITLPSAAQIRLPFHLIFFGTSQNFWKILCTFMSLLRILLNSQNFLKQIVTLLVSLSAAEFSEESFPTLLLISKLMKFSLDTLYVSMAKHVFEKKLKPKLLKLTQAKPSLLMNKEITKLAQTIESYLLSIVNPEWAVAIAISLAQDVPEGSFKMSSLKFCLYLAKQWLQNVPPQGETHEKAEALLKKLRVQYQRSGTEAVLIAHRLNSAAHLQALGKPAHLIVSLFKHPSVSQRLRDSAGGDSPDIHAAAKEIAEVNDINLEKIWEMLLEKWLCLSTKPESSSELFELQEDATLQRVLYLLQAWPTDHSSRMLFLLATSATTALGTCQLTFAHRARALQCLLCLADKDTVESLFKKPLEEVKSYMKCITFLASFEALNIPITYEVFCNSSKEGMVKGLWKNHSHEAMGGLVSGVSKLVFLLQAVRLVTELCLEYRVYDLQLWNGLLQKLLGFNMVSETRASSLQWVQPLSVPAPPALMPSSPSLIPYLRKVLTAISSVHPLWQVPYFSKAWQHTVQMPLLAASCPLSPGQLSECRESLVAVLKCPVSGDLDMVSVARQYAQLELPAFTLACLVLMPHSERRRQQIKNFLGSCDPQIILQQVEEHMSTGQLAGFSHQIRSLVLHDIVSKKEFGTLAKSRYFPLLKSQVMSSSSVADLVSYLANESRTAGNLHRGVCLNEPRLS